MIDTALLYLIGIICALVCAGEGVVNRRWFGAALYAWCAVMLLFWGLLG